MKNVADFWTEKGLDFTIFWNTELNGYTGNVKLNGEVVYATTDNVTYQTLRSTERDLETNAPKINIYIFSLVDGTKTAINYTKAKAMEVLELVDTDILNVVELPLTANFGEVY